MTDAVSVSFLDRFGELGGADRGAPASRVAARDARLVLATRGWLATCPAAFAEAVLTAAEIVEVPRDHEILGWDTPGRDLWGLATGGLYVAVAGPDGSLHKMDLGTPGLWVGETALLGETSRTVAVTTTVASCFARLPAERIAELARTHPDTWRHLGRLAAMNTTTAMASVSCLLNRDSAARVAQKLLQVDHGDEGALVSLTQTALGEMVGLSRNTLNRVLASLERVGALHVGYARVQVRDRAKLQHVARGGRAD